MARAAAPAAPTNKRPLDSDFYQQRLKAWQPILTPKWVIFTFLVIGIPFIIIGFVLKTASDNVVEVKLQYDGAGADPALLASCGVTTPTLVNVTRRCWLNFTAPADMKGPLYLYYELENFYQNHRRYVKSRSDAQLAGTTFLSSSSASGASDCDPLRSTADGKFLHPCGLIANSVFNDTFRLATPGYTLNEKGIAWSTDVSKKFKAVASQYYEQYNATVSFLNDRYPQFRDVDDEHFIVWMRPAALPTFRKLYGRIEGAGGESGITIAKGTPLSFDLGANYPVDAFGGKKSLVVSTLSFVGGKNAFLGIAYIVVGFASVALAGLFGAKQLLGGRKLGDTSYLVYAARRS